MIFLLAIASAYCAMCYPSGHKRNDAPTQVSTLKKKKTRFFHVSVILYEKQTCTKHRKEVEGTGCTVS